MMTWVSLKLFQRPFFKLIKVTLSSVDIWMELEELWFIAAAGQFTKFTLELAQTFHQSLSIVICGETLTTFKTRGLHLKASLITMATIKITLFQMLAQGIGMIQICW